MDAIILTKEALEEIKREIKTITEHLQRINPPLEDFVTNKEFVEKMNISFKTAQTWRDQGKIGFVKEGKKIYYRNSDIKAFFENYYHKPFKPIKNRV